MVYKFSIPGPENFFNIDFFECRSHITVLFKILHKKKMSRDVRPGEEQVTKYGKSFGLREHYVGGRRPLKFCLCGLLRPLAVKNFFFKNFTSIV